jgi:FixJ family two-component response regulator
MDEERDTDAIYAASDALQTAIDKLVSLREQCRQTEKEKQRLEKYFQTLCDREEQILRRKRGVR